MEYNCSICNKKFIPAEANNKKYCSESCRKIGKRKIQKKYEDKPEIKARKLKAQKKYRENPDVKKRKKEYQREWYQKNKDTEERKERHRKSSLKYYNDLKKDPVKYSKFKLIHNLRKRISEVLKVKKTNNSGKGSKLFGCTSQQLRDHLENQFKPGMTWENYGKWHVDHIVPVSSFNLNDIEQRNKCYNYTNLQPLWAEENMKKSNK